MGGGAPGAAAHDRSQDRRSGRPSVRLPRPPGGQHVYQQGGHPDALPQGRSLAQRRLRPHHQPPRPRDYRQPALQRQGADDPVRAAGLARTPLARDDAALRPDHAEHADQGLHRCRLLRPQRAHNRGADRPRGGAERRGGCGRALAALRPWPRLLQLHVLRAVPPPDGLRTLRLLHSQAKRQGAAARSQGGCGPQAGADPAHRWRARSRRAGSAGRGQAARRPGEYADPGRPNAPRTCGAPVTFALSAIFHITLNKWLLAMHLMTASKKGMSAHQLHRMLGVTYQSAWFMAHRLREAMADDPKSSSGPLGGEEKVIEVDETYVGGKAKNRAYAKKPPKKKAVVALVEGKGKVKSVHFPNVTSETLRPILVKHASRKSRLMTDESNLYPKIGEEFAEHDTVNHSANEYVRGDAHTNTAEGYFSIFKRGIYGVYHHVSEAHLHRYLVEFDFRHNTRTKLGVNDTERAANALEGMVGKRLTYREIGGATNA